MGRRRKRRGKSVEASRGTPPPGKNTRPSRRASSDLSLAELKRLVSEREHEVETLQARRQALMMELDEIDRAIERHLGTGGRGPAPARAAPTRSARSAAKPNPTPATTAPADPKGASPDPSRSEPMPVANRALRGKIHEVIRQVLTAAQGPMKLREIASAVIAAGYPTTSNKFGVIVGQRIVEMPDVQKIGRGVYQLIS